MASEEPLPDHPFERSPDQEYFQALEKEIIALRGAPLYFSPADFQVAREWRRDGVPLDLVLETVGEVIEKKREAEKEVPIRLSYYRRAVSRAWEDRRRLTAPAAPAADAGPDTRQRLKALADALATVLPEAPWATPVSHGLSALVEDSVAGGAGGAEALEARLAELDDELLRAAWEAADADHRRRIEERSEASIAALAGRLSEAEKERNLARLRSQVLRRESDLPTLSLFGPEAAAAEATDDTAPGIGPEQQFP